MNPDSSLPVVTRRSDGKRFRIVLQARSFDGPVSLTACDGPPFENVETSGEAFARDFDDPRKAAPAAAKPEPVLCYGSDNAGGVVLWVGEERVRLDAARVAALIEGLRREAALPPRALRPPLRGRRRARGVDHAAGPEADGGAR